jgi:ATP-binding cassette, subfamily G (WHITE), member 2, PDR
VLYEGRQIYFGTRDAAKKYFTDMGYHCPERQTTADFLTSLTNPSERIVAPGFEKQVPRTPDEFAHAWKHSSTRTQLLEEISVFEADTLINDDYITKLKTTRKAQQAPLT